MTLTGENGLLTKTITAKEEYKMAQAREKLVVALTGAHIEKKKIGRASCRERV